METQEHKEEKIICDECRKEIKGEPFVRTIKQNYKNIRKQFCNEICAIHAQMSAEG